MRLSVTIFRNEQGGYIASCPSLPGCRCLGQTRQEAAKKLDDAIRGYIAAINNFVPEHLTPEVVEV